VNVVVVVELQKNFASELRVVIGDNGVRNPEAVDDIREKQHRLLGLDFGDGASLDPLRELVHGDK
jgi:hypothetical protein